MKQAFIYSLKVWLTTSIVTPLLLTLLRFLTSRKWLKTGHYDQQFVDRVNHRLLTKLLYTVAGNFVVLIPLALVLYYTIAYLVRRELSFTRYKPYLSLTGIIVAVLPQGIMLAYMVAVTGSWYAEIYIVDIIVYSIFYAIVVLASIWFYKLTPGIGQTEEEFSE